MGLELDKYGEDYELTSDAAWISIKGFSVHLKKRDGGIEIDVYPRMKEMEDPLLSQSFSDDEGYQGDLRESV
jgi:hypothetical protein